MKKLTRNRVEKKEPSKSVKAVETPRNATREQAQCCAKVSSIVVGCHD